MTVMCDGVFRDFSVSGSDRERGRKAMGFDAMLSNKHPVDECSGIVAALQSTMAVVCNDLSGCTEEKMVARTLNSLGFPTFWTICTSKEEVANIAVGLLFKNPFFWHQVLHCQRVL
jgi:hypothetical protein